MSSSVITITGAPDGRVYQIEPGRRFVGRRELVDPRKPTTFDLGDVVALSGTVSPVVQIYTVVDVVKP